MRPNGNYRVTVRGPLPSDLGRKIAEAHAAAVKDAVGRMLDAARVQEPRA